MTKRERQRKARGLRALLAAALKSETRNAEIRAMGHEAPAPLHTPEKLALWARMVAHDIK